MIFLVLETGVCFYLLHLLDIQRNVFSYLYLCPWLMGTLIAYKIAGIPMALFLCYFGIILYISATIDWHYMILPDEGLILLVIGAVGFNLYIGRSIEYSHVIASVGSMLFFFLLRMMSHGGMGWGDIKYVGILTFLSGSNGAVYVLCGSFILGAIYAACFFNTLKRTSLLPFGPFLNLSGGMVFLWEEVVKKGFYIWNF